MLFTKKYAYLLGRSESAANGQIQFNVLDVAVSKLNMLTANKNEVVFSVLQEMLPLFPSMAANTTLFCGTYHEKENKLTVEGVIQFFSNGGKLAFGLRDTAELSNAPMQFGLKSVADRIRFYKDK
jgi:hypothetical protein